MPLVKGKWVNPPRAFPITEERWKEIEEIEEQEEARGMMGREDRRIPIAEVRPGDIPGRTPHWMWLEQEARGKRKWLRWSPEELALRRTRPDGGRA